MAKIRSHQEVMTSPEDYYNFVPLTKMRKVDSKIVNLREQTRKMWPG